MNGYTLKIVMATFISIIFLSTSTFATNADIYNKQLGCMMCHQGSSVKDIHRVTQHHKKTK